MSAEDVQDLPRKRRILHVRTRAVDRPIVGVWLAAFGGVAIAVVLVPDLSGILVLVIAVLAAVAAQTVIRARDPKPSQHVRSQQQRASRFVGGALLLVIALNMYAPGDPTGLMRILASLLIVISVIPTWRWLMGRDESLPFFPMLMAVYSFGYGTPVFIRSDFDRKSFIGGATPIESMEYALVLAVLGLIAVLAGFYFVRPRMRRLGSSMSRRLFPSGFDSSAAGTFWATSLIGLPVMVARLMVPTPVVLNQPARLMESLTVLGAIGLFALWWKGQLPPRLTLYLWVVLMPALILLRLGGSQIDHALQFAGAILLLIGSQRRRASWLLIVVAVAALVLFQAAKTEFRSERGLGVSDNPIGDARDFATTLRDVASESELDAATMTEAALARFDYFSRFAEVVEATPSQIPYWSGVTYYPLLTKPIPRFFFPGKPLEDIGQRYGHRYSFILPNDDITSENLPQLVELYINFGPIGVIVGMLLLGGFYAVLQTFFSTNTESRLLGVVGGPFVLAGLLTIESNFSNVVVGGLYGIVPFGIFVVVLKRRSSGLMNRPSKR